MPSNFYTPVALKYVPEPEGNLAMLDADGQIEKLSILPDETITCAIDELQATIDRLPKYLNRNVTINVDPGTTTDEIAIENFSGPGWLSINGALAAQTQTHEILRCTVRQCTLARITIRGITATADTGSAFQIVQCNLAMVYIYQCCAVNGDSAVSSIIGIYMNEATHVYPSQCLISNKYYAYWSRSGRMRVATAYGTNNNIGYYAGQAGMIGISVAGSMAATTLYSAAAGSMIVDSRGDVVTTNTTTAQSYTVDIENLQATINQLPKRLNRPITINVNPGVFAGTITIENFTGSGILQILGANAAGDFTRQVTRVVIQNCNVSYMYIRGISANATTGNGFYINQVSSAFLYLYFCNVAGDGSGTPGAGGNPATTTNFGFYSYRSLYAYASACTVSDKYRAFYCVAGRMDVAGGLGENNRLVFSGATAGHMQVATRGTIDGTTEYSAASGSLIITDLGDVITPAGHASFPRRTSDLALNLTTDEINAGQTLAALIETRVQDTLFVNSGTFYTLRINIMQGVSTTQSLRIIGLRMRLASVVLHIDPGVILALLTLQDNTVGSLVVNNCGNIGAIGSTTGNVNISYNTATRGDVSYVQNYASTVAPAYPTTHPLSGPIPIERSVVTGGIMMTQNRAYTVNCLIGQFCEVGEVNADGLVAGGTAPAIDTNQAGVIQLTRNRCDYNCHVTVYSTYMENDPVIPGPIVASTIYLYYNYCGYSCYATLQSGWKDGTQPTLQNVYVYNNFCGLSAYQNIGNSVAATTFNAYWSATVLADTQNTSRNVITLSADPLPGRADNIVGMNFTFTNYATTSSANNFTGTFKNVTAYNPATREVTLSANFTAARPANATGYFFPRNAANNTKFYYGTSVKIQAMLQTAFDTAAPLGIYQADGNNIGNAFQVADLDTTNKVVTLDRQLVSAGVYNATMSPVGGFAFKSVNDLSTTYTRLAGTDIFTGTTDLRLYPYLTDGRLIGLRVTGTGITGSMGITDAVWNGANLRITLDGSPTPPAFPLDPTAQYTLVLRRVPGHGVHQVYYNHCGGDAYCIVGTYGVGAVNGGIGIRNANCGYNTCSNAYVDIRGFTGAAINPGAALRVSYAYLLYNSCNASCYMIARAKQMDRITIYGNSCVADFYCQLATYLNISREVQVYYNRSDYRLRIVGLATAGVTTGATTVPQLQAHLYIYRNVAPQVFADLLNIKPALASETGLATNTQCIYFLENLTQRTFINSASMWLDISNNTAANSCCIWVNINPNFQYNFALPSTYAGAQNYALRVLDSANCRIAVSPAGMNKIMLSGYSSATFASTLSLANVFKTDHQEGRDANVTIFQRGETVDEPRAPVAHYTTPGTYTFVVPITGPWIVAAGGAGGGGAVYLDGTPVIAGGGSGALASAHSTGNLAAGTSLTVTVGARGTAFVGAATAGAGTAGGNSSVTGGGITVTGNGGGGGTVNATTGTGGAGGTYTVTGMTNTASEAGTVGTATSGGRRAFKDLLTMQGRIIVGSGKGGSATATGATAGFDGSVLIFLDE